MIICTAATRNSPYEPLLEKQRAHYGNKIVTTILPETSWSEGTKIKPRCIMEAFNVDPIVLWVDADCHLDLPSKAPEGSWDVCIFDNIHPKHINKISAAFILFRNTVKARRFLKRWERNNKYSHKDHPAFIKTIREMQNTVKIQNKTDWLKGRHTINALLPERGLYK